MSAFQIQMPIVKDEPLLMLEKKKCYLFPSTVPRGNKRPAGGKEAHVYLCSAKRMSFDLVPAESALDDNSKAH